MPTMVKVKCAYCNKEYDKVLKYFNNTEKRKQNHFCSLDCQRAFRRAIPNTQCTNCGKQIYKKTSTVNRSVSGNTFCSRSCATSYNNSKRLGINNPNFVHGIGSYRAAAFRSNKKECAVCGWNDDERILEVHHKDENRFNNKPDNLIILCPTCHTKISLGYYILDENKLIRV